MQTQDILIERLHRHPANCNVMPEKLFDKLAGQLERGGLYPPVIVRAIGEGYQILDGHHRVLALQKIGRTEACCVVWEVGDDEALLLLATLNRLRGRDDLLKRADLMAELRGRFEVGQLAARLPEDVEGIEKLLALHAPPASPRAPQRLEDMPVAVHFFLLPVQLAMLNRCLAQAGGPREEALMRLVERGAGCACAASGRGGTDE